MTLIQARLHDRLACIGIPPEHRPRYLSQVSGLIPARVDSLLAGTMPASKMGTDDLNALATGLEVPGWWLVLPFTAETH